MPHQVVETLDSTPELCFIGLAGDCESGTYLARTSLLMTEVPSLHQPPTTGELPEGVRYPQALVRQQKSPSDGTCHPDT